MTNGEKYTKALYTHYVSECMCPKCRYTLCGREPSDFRECFFIKDKYDYEQWLSQEADSEQIIEEEIKGVT